MKKTIFLAIPIMLSSLWCKSQCPGNIVYHASKMEMLDSLLHVGDSKEVTATVSTSGTRIVVYSGDMGSDTMTGVIKKSTCNWSEPYKNGKTVIIADMQMRQELLKDMLITVEAIDGKMTILLHADEHPNDLVKLYIDKYEEDKPKK